MYEALILIDPEMVITAEQVAVALREYYQGKHYQGKQDAPTEIVHAGQSIKLVWDGYTLELYRSSASHVLEESMEIAQRFGQMHSSRDRIALCACRFEMSGDDDADMHRFNDYLFVGEQLSRLGRVYRFDQASSEFMD